MELAKALDVRPGVTAIIGGGGKTTLMECLAEELSAQARVIVCTTTHIYPEQNMPCLVSTSEAEIAAELARTRASAWALLQKAENTPRRSCRSARSARLPAT